MAATLTVAQISARLLSYPAIAVADALEANYVGLRGWLVDAILDAYGQIARKGGGKLEEPIGSVLKGPQTVSVTIDAATPAAIVIGTAGIIPNDLCTLRIPQASCDCTIKAIAGNGLSGAIAPGYDGISTGTFTGTATVWHDAWKISDGLTVRNEGTRLRVGGRELERVNSRDEAERLCGMDARGLPPGRGRRLVTLTQDLPRVWWVESYRASTFLCVYPMPGYAMPVEARVQLGGATIDEGNVLTSTETFGLTEEMSRLVWLPLAVDAFRRSPHMANSAVKEEIAAQVVRAYEILNKVGPKPEPPAPWNAGGIHMGRRACYGGYGTRR